MSKSVNENVSGEDALELSEEGRFLSQVHDEFHAKRKDIGRERKLSSGRDAGVWKGV